MNGGPETSPEVRQARAPHTEPPGSEWAGRRLLSLEAAALYLHVSTWTVRALESRGEIHRAPLPGVRRLLFDREDLDRLVNREKV